MAKPTRAEKRAGKALPGEMSPGVDRAMPGAVTKSVAPTGYMAAPKTEVPSTVIQPPAGPEVLQSQIAEARRQAILEKMGYGIDPMAADIPGPGGS